jgi:electron transfer flavoprotein alpha subunit
MKMADLGVVGDLHDILPELIKKIRDIKKEDSDEV